MEFEDNSLIRSLHILKNIDFQALGTDPLVVTTIRHLVDEVFLEVFPVAGGNTAVST